MEGRRNKDKKSIALTPEIDKKTTTLIQTSLEHINNYMPSTPLIVRVNILSLLARPRDGSTLEASLVEI
jgi:hypothetical protein